MEYAIQLLLPIIGALLLGNWLTNTFHISQLWTVLLAILGMVGGIAILYRKSMDPANYKDLKKIVPKDDTPGKPHEHWTDIKKQIESENPDDWKHPYDHDDDPDA